MPMGNLTKKSEWLESFHQSISSLDVQSQSYSIYLVPEGLKKCNEDAYMPRVVSMGPRFVGREDIEEMKLRCMLSLLHRGSGEASESLEACGETISKLVEKVGASYAPEIFELRKLSDLQLAKIMLLDGCFLLELLASTFFDYRYPSRLLPPGSPAAEMKKNHDVLSDLMLIENQIPIYIIYELSQTLFPESFRQNSKEIIDRLVLTLLGYSPKPFQEVQHILDLVHLHISSGDITSTPRQDHVVVDIIGATQTPSQQHLKLNRCALRLLTAGVTMKAKFQHDHYVLGFGAVSCLSLVRNSLCGILFWLSNIFVVKGKHMDRYGDILKPLDFYFRFENRKLEIEQLHITKTTKAKWCSLIALEHHQKIQSIKNQGTGSPRGCSSTFAALIFDGLICSEDDVQFLKDKKIVVDHVNMSNQELIKFFREIALGIDHRVVDSSSYYTRMVYEINNISKAFFVKRIWSTVLNSFTYRQEWLLRFLNRNYNFVATVISLCTVVQTIYAIIAYQLPK